MKIELAFPNGTSLSSTKFSEIIAKLEEIKLEDDEVNLTVTFYMEVLVSSKTRESLQTSTSGKPNGLIKYLTDIRSVLSRAYESGQRFKTALDVEELETGEISYFGMPAHGLLLVED
jgi:hypothetical protein